ncbi:MAG: Mut7-C RNAse domain-containing protein, partial [Dehalococcoidia bacterium]|nr:Mut7-C RNAse domain-containing protein [Dehalococcoidia bacterium]
MEIKFIVDNNVGKLAKWLRIMGYDALLLSGEDDGRMVKVALAQNRVILTKDTQIMRRRLVTSGRLKAIL